MTTERVYRLNENFKIPEKICRTCKFYGQEPLSICWGYCHNKLVTERSNMDLLLKYDFGCIFWQSKEGGDGK